MAKDSTPTRTAVPSEKTKLLQERILTLYRDNPNFNAIARELGFTHQYTRKMYKAALKAIIVDSVEDHRKIELARLDKIHTECMKIVDSFHPVVSAGGVVRDVRDDANGNPIIDEDTQNPVTYRLEDVGPRLSAIDRALRAADRRAKLLGLDAPVKTAFTDPSGEREAVYVQFYLPSNGRD